MFFEKFFPKSLTAEFFKIFPFKNYCVYVSYYRICCFSAISDLVLIGVHIRPDSNGTEAEINALVPVYEEAVMRYDTTNVIIMGDMNADCSYLPNYRYDRLTFTTDDRFLWLIGKDSDTTVSNSDCAYDRYA